jgi:hypothetical protein
MFPGTIQFDGKYQGKYGPGRHVIWKGETFVDYQPIPDTRQEGERFAHRCGLLEFAGWAKQELDKQAGLLP